MAHRMMVHLVQSVRTRLVLTLNFDDLIEQAYREAHIDPAVFEVHYNASLPPFSLLGTDHTIIKLHGAKYGLRADLTLDREPSEVDKQHFRDYLTGSSSGGNEDGHLKPPIRNILIVAGISGRDRRVRRLIEDLLRDSQDHITKGGKLDHAIQIFWQCYSDDDAKTLDDGFKHLGFAKHPDGKVHQLLFATRASHLGLLFWDIYQQVTRSLPSRRFDFPAVTEFAGPPLLQPNEESRLSSRHSRNYGNLATWIANRDKATRSYSRTNSQDEQPALILSDPNEAKSDHSSVLGVGWHHFQL